MSNPCPYCEEFEEGFLRVEGENLGNRILLETPDFVVFPTLGCFVEGYLLIATRVHYVGIGQMPSTLNQELEKIQKKVRDALSTIYGVSPVFFEHGSVSTEKCGGNSIFHAHLHALPVEVDVVGELSQRFSCEPITDLARLQSIHSDGSPYLFWENGNGSRFVFKVTSEIPSQFLRQLIAEKLGIPKRWNWRTYPGLEEMKRTIGALQGQFT